MKKKQLSIERLLGLVDEPNRSGLRRMLVENRSRFEASPGSVHNHQAWPGGYMCHIREIMNLAVVLYPVYSGLRNLPFSLSDLLTVLFLHDLEKPWKYVEPKVGLYNRKAKCKFRLAKLAEYNIVLTPELRNGMEFVEGENDGTYSETDRAMGELAAFCHICDVSSARLWHDRPLEDGETWGSR